LLKTPETSSVLRELLKDLIELEHLVEPYHVARLREDWPRPALEDWLVETGRGLGTLRWAQEHRRGPVGPWNEGSSSPGLPRPRHWWWFLTSSAPNREYSGHAHHLPVLKHDQMGNTPHWPTPQEAWAWLLERPETLVDWRAEG
jgi:hypothetical protein